LRLKKALKTTKFRKICAETAHLCTILRCKTHAKSMFFLIYRPKAAVLPFEIDMKVRNCAAKPRETTVFPGLSAVPAVCIRAQRQTDQPRRLRL
jgi:hypothetical protein